MVAVTVEFLDDDEGDDPDPPPPGGRSRRRLWRPELLAPSLLVAAAGAALAAPFTSFELLGGPTGPYPVDGWGRVSTVGESSPEPPWGIALVAAAGVALFAGAMLIRGALRPNGAGGRGTSTLPMLAFGLLAGITACLGLRLHQLATAAGSSNWQPVLAFTVAPSPTSDLTATSPPYVSTLTATGEPDFAGVGWCVWLAAAATLLALAAAVLSARATNRQVSRPMITPATGS